MAGVTYMLESAADVAKDIDELARKKPDYVKIWVDDTLGHGKRMPLEISKAIIDNARKHGLRVFAHIFYLEDAKQLSDAGVVALMHSVRDKPVDEALIQSMKAHHVWQAAATITGEESVFVFSMMPAFPDDPFFI